MAGTDRRPLICWKKFITITKMYIYHAPEVAAIAPWAGWAMVMISEKWSRAPTQQNRLTEAKRLPWKRQMPVHFFFCFHFLLPFYSFYFHVRLQMHFPVNVGNMFLEHSTKAHNKARELLSRVASTDEPIKYRAKQ